MRQEHRHHSDEQIRDALAFGAALVDELAIADDLRPEAFRSAVHLRTQKSITEMTAQPVPLGALAIPNPRPGHR